MSSASFFFLFLFLFFFFIFGPPSSPLPSPSQDDEDDDEVSFIASLRKAVAEAWQGIVQAFLPMPDAAPAERRAMAAQAEEHVFKYLPHMLPLLGSWMRDVTASRLAPGADFDDDDDENEEVLETLKIFVGLVGDIGALWGKASMQSAGFRAGDPTLKAILDLEEKLEKDSWDGDTRDADGNKRTTVASWARENLPR